ncbi:HAD family phosphatase [Aphelenchoides fujianensis]|nr:HAD family phosphatase [Aphelenchoides fujianensis]
MLAYNTYGRNRLLDERLSMARRGLKNLFKAVVFQINGAVVHLRHVDEYDRLNQLLSQNIESRLFEQRSIEVDEEDAEAQVVDETAFLHVIRIGSPKIQKVEVNRMEALLTAEGSLPTDGRMFDAIRKLASHGFKIALLADGSRSTRNPAVMEETQNLEGAAESFDTCKVTPRKAQAEIYQSVLDKLGLLAAESIYVGPLASQVRGVERVGITGIQVVNEDSGTAISTLEQLLNIELH